MLAGGAEGPGQGLVTGEKSKQGRSQGKQPLPAGATGRGQQLGLRWGGQRGMLGAGWGWMDGAGRGWMGLDGDG